MTGTVSETAQRKSQNSRPLRPKASQGAGQGNTMWLGLPLVVVLGFLLLWPLLILFIESVTFDDGSLSLQRYIDVLSSQRYLRALGWTVLLAAVSTLLALIICIPAGLYLKADESTFGRVISVALTIPLSLPGIVIGFFVILMVGNTGVVPLVIENLTGSRQLQVAYTGTGLVLAYLYFQIPRVVLVVRGAAAAVRQETIDAARSLGASTWTIYGRIILPALRPAIASASALAMATAFGAFGTAATLNRGQRVMPQEVAAAFTDNFQPELAATLSIILAAVTTAVLVGINALGEKKVVSSRI